ncbi:YugN family protein [Salsuginibacillus kocurii]|uniref:YugN family protein n=1 Tax=Salsuginibacillus kocurii TaxID=427078 RepID=UPI00037D0283|nr:YugN family protein [Salsuginibacillus kocurii]
MKLTNFDLQDKEVNFAKLKRVMEENSFVHAEQWDYQRATFDIKMLDKTDDATYYLRVPVIAVDGEIPKKSATVKILTPYLGRHYYPHGVEYDEEFPNKITSKCEAKLKAVEEELNSEL